MGEIVPWRVVDETRTKHIRNHWVEREDRSEGPGGRRRWIDDASTSFLPRVDVRNPTHPTGRIQERSWDRADVRRNDLHAHVHEASFVKARLRGTHARKRPRAMRQQNEANR